MRQKAFKILSQTAVPPCMPEANAEWEAENGLLKECGTVFFTSYEMPLATVNICSDQFRRGVS